MKKPLIDTNIISAFMRGDPSVIQKTEKYLRFHRTLNELVVITDNTRHFDRIDNLKVSNWLH